MPAWVRKTHLLRGEQHKAMGGAMRSTWAAVGVKQALRALEILLAQLVQLRLQAVQLILPPLLHVKEADTKEHEENHLPAEDDEEPIRLATARRNFLTPAGCEGASLGMRRVHRRMRRPRTSAHAGHGAAPDGDVHETRDRNHTQTHMWGALLLVLPVKRQRGEPGHAALVYMYEVLV